MFVELPSEFHAYGRFARIRRWLGEAGRGGVQGKSCCADDFLQHGDQGETRGARRRLHLSGTQVELKKMRGLFKKWSDVKDRGIIGSGTGGDVKEVVIF